MRLGQQGGEAWRNLRSRFGAARRQGLDSKVAELDSHGGAGVDLEGNYAGGGLVVGGVDGYRAVELELDAPRS